MSSEPTPPLDAADEPIDAAEHARGLALERSRRLGQLDAMRSAGTNPYPYRFDRTHTLADIRSEFGALEAGSETEVHVEVAGRMLLKRDQGKLIFASLRDRDGDIQLFVSKAIVGDELFDAINALDLGDWVGVSGLVMTTRKGELSIKVNTLVLLAKAVRPLPDKWHGLTDPDTRYRQRYADLISNDEARRAFAIRHAIIASFRKTLSAKSFIEVETPVLHAEAGGAHAAEKQALLKALGDLNGMVGVLVGHAMASQESAPEIYKVGLNTSRVLMAVGDIITTWLLLRQADIAAGLIENASAKDKDFYTGKIASAKFFVTKYLPHITADRKIVEATDSAIMDISESAF